MNKSSKRTALFAAVMFSAGVLVSRVLAEGVPQTTPLFYSGVLTNGGVPAAGPLDLQIEIWSEAGPGTGTNLCIAPFPATVLISGGFRVALPQPCVDAVRANSEVWVEVKAGATSFGRTKLGAVPYALEAERAVSAGGALALQVVPQGAVMAFDLDACPTGWSELTSARGRTVVSTNPDTSNGLSARARGATFGEESHTLTLAEAPSHDHGGATGGTVLNGGAYTHYLDGNIAGGTQPRFEYRFDLSNASRAFQDHQHTLAPAGGGQAHNIIQPSIALLYCKKD